MPAALERDDPLLFLPEGEILDVLEQLIGVDPAEIAAVFAGAREGGERGAWGAAAGGWHVRRRWEAL